ncbi:MAG: hypothetical protein NTZ83_03885 [Candidatus Pacearchaeota archaeon]|nr:hypothetical protein [Candidatus Pacearchaeota archaeon]
MEKIKFIHRVSKGTRFNQIYIPREMQTKFEPGYLVEVTLLEQGSVYYSPNLQEISKFKQELIKNIFLELKKYKEISQIFVIGSFLTQKQDFNDIDIILITDKADNNPEKEVFDNLLGKFELKFHVISIPKDKFDSLQKNDPLTRSMLYYYVTNKEFKLSGDIQINKEHLKFLLMMPQDVLKIKLNSRVYYDSIRRLIAIEKFLENKPLDPLSIDNEMKKNLFQEVASLDLV